MSQSTLQAFWQASRTVRFRTTAGAALIVVLALFLGVRAALAIEEQELRSNLEGSLSERTAQVVAAIKASEELPTALSTDGDEVAAQLVSGNGVPVAASNNLIGEPPIAGGFRPNGLREAREVDALPFDNQRFMVMGQRFTSDEQVYTLYLAASVEPLYEAMSTLRWTLLVGAALLAVIVTAMTWWLVGRALAPVETMRAQVANITAHELDRRLPSRGTHDELGRLATTMNEMLARLEEAQARQQQFVADASRELAGPLASIRSQLEGDLQRSGDATPIETEHAVLGETIRLQRLTNDLLSLARTDSGAPVQSEPVDLDAIILEEVEQIRATWPVFVDTMRVSSAQPVGDPELLRRLVSNLLENAAQHARERVTVELVEDRSTGWIELRVDDDGPGIAEDQRDRIFDRFTRLDDGRGPAGAGLGLPMVRDILERHGGAIRVATSVEGGARFDVRLPIARAAQQWPAA